MARNYVEDCKKLIRIIDYQKDKILLLEAQQSHLLKELHKILNPILEKNRHK